MAPIVEAVSPLYVEPVAARGFLAGGDAIITCPFCRSRLGDVHYAAESVELSRWGDGRWQRTTIDPPLVPIGIDMATGLPAFGLRTRARRQGGTPSRGRVGGRLKTRDSKASGAPRAAILHCGCGHRLEMDLPDPWSPDRFVRPSSGPARAMSDMEIEITIRSVSKGVARDATYPRKRGA